ncbi:(2E,6E)-farnesyl diphosphate synthase [Mangrovibacter plantisponsor]|uniref:Farnesyl-diphosphate synthase n=1 Tax=Mangrovibacter plantisponsor TaxID=451513 RepID=A0A317Q296_9ENTR|nr:(2E,6E)-farnesyl diphosphate synthase [Mangrovibacter plantisponsor]PWW09511.1 farnesyl-diphosphate synthase [Mangrovibacter plantisponsor]
MDFNQLLTVYAARANTAIAGFINTLPFQGSALVGAMEYGALLGGKRLRPFLVYATGKMLGMPLSVLDTPAAAIECIHAYSLIHDDLPAMDDDDLRRGQPTCHIRFGEATAILAGDALQTLAFSILSDTDMPGVSDSSRVAMLRELASASGAAGMCAGQALDLEAEGKHVDLAALERIHRHKTGALIRAAVRLGALSAGEKGAAALPLLSQFSDNIGLAFQVQDDILDVIGDTATLGKRQGADIHLGKSTYPALLGLEQAQTRAHQLCTQALEALAGLRAQHLDTQPLEALAHFIIQRDK